MKYIITENQHSELVKRVIKRREREIMDMMWEMLHNTDIGYDASEYPSNEYVIYVAELIVDDFFGKGTFNDRDYYPIYEYEVRKLIEDDVLKYWENNN